METPPPTLDRKLGFWSLWALGVGAVVGDGIFLLLGDGIARAGPSAFQAFLLAGLFQLFLMVALGELAVGMPDAGAMSVWVGRLVGNCAGFLAGFAFALGWVFAGGSVGLALGRTTCWFFFGQADALWTAAFAVGCSGTTRLPIWLLVMSRTVCSAMMRVPSSAPPLSIMRMNRA